MSLRKFASIGLVATGLMSIAFSANAGIVSIPAASFTASAGVITFSEFAVGTVNPTYTAAQYGGGGGSPVVTFGGFFMGQHLGASSPPCPPGAALSGCVLSAADSYTNPTANSPLALDPSSPNTFITTDGSNPTSPVLSGTPTFNGPVAILFSSPQSGVGLDGGFFNAVASTAITAFDAEGNVLGQVQNTITGIEFLGLVTSDGSATISGLLFSLVGAEPAGFAIDNVRFGIGEEVVVPGVPEPATLALFGAGLAGFGTLRRRKKA